MWKNTHEEQYISLLKAATNTRDLGGYQTESLQQTKPFSVLRSSCPTNTNADDIAFLREHCPITEESEIPASVEAVPVSYMEIAGAVEMPEVFRCIARAPEGVIFHCSAGKDRTGVVSAILLLHAGVERRDIVYDYALSREYNRSRMEALIKRRPEIADIVTPKEAYMERFLELFREKYSDTTHYFKGLGLTEEEIINIRSKLIF